MSAHDPELEKIRQRKRQALEGTATAPATPSEPVALTADQVDTFLGQHDHVILDFWAPWCGPCKAIAPVLEQVAKERQDVAIGKVNVDEHPAAAQGYQVQGIPTLVLAKGGRPVDRIVGAVPKAKLLARLDALGQA